MKVIIRHIIGAKGSVGYLLDEFGRVANSAGDRVIFKRMYLSWRPT